MPERNCEFGIENQSRLDKVEKTVKGLDATLSSLNETLIDLNHTVKYVHVTDEHGMKTKVDRDDFHQNTFHMHRTLLEKIEDTNKAIEKQKKWDFRTIVKDIVLAVIGAAAMLKMFGLL